MRDRSTAVRLLIFAAMAAIALPTSAAAGAPAGQHPGTETVAHAARQLYAQSRAGDFSDHVQSMAPGLRAVVERDAACGVKEGVCELDMDPWVAGGGQEGGVEGDPRFEVLARAAKEARVRMDYTYAYSSSSKEAQSTCVLLSRVAPDAPWQLADLMPRCEDGSSLLARLRKAYPAARPAH